MDKKGLELTFTTLVQVLVIFIVAVILIKLAFIGKDAWLVKSGHISEDTAKMLESIYPYKVGAEPVEQLDLTPPDNVKAVYESLKEALRFARQSKEENCLIDYDQKDLEHGYSIALIDKDDGVEMQIIKSRNILIEKDFIPGAELCVVDALHYGLGEGEHDYYNNLNRLDIEYDSGLFIPDRNYVYIDRNYKARFKTFLDDSYHINLLLKTDDKHYCLILFARASGSGVFNRIAFSDGTDKARFFDKHFKENEQPGTDPYYRPWCKKNDWGLRS